MGVRALGAAGMAPEGVTQPVPNAIDELRKLDVDIRRLGTENLDRIDSDIRRLGVTPAPPGGWQLPFGATAPPSFVPPGMTRAGGAPAWVPPGIGMGGGGGGGGPPGAAGAPGGGGGGGGWGGFGWGAAAGAAAARGLGLGRTAALIGRMAGTGIEVGLVAEAVKEVVMSPQHFAGLAQSSFNAAAPWLNQAYGLAGYGRAGGYGYDMSLMGQFYAGGGRATAMMSRLGITQPEALQYLQQFGIVQPSAAGAGRLVGALGAARFLPGFSGLPDSAASQFLGQMAGAGVIGGTAGGAAVGAVQVGDILTRAVTLGMDRTSVLRSIDSGVHALIGVGAMGVSMSRLGAFMTGFPGEPGRSGEYARMALGGIESAVGSIGTNPIRTLIATQFGMQFKSLPQLQAYVEKAAPGLWGQISNTPNKMTVLNNLVAASKAGNAYAVAYYVQQLISADPKFAAMVLNSPGIQKMVPAYMRAELGGQILNVPAVAGLDIGNPAGAIPTGMMGVISGMPAAYNPRNDEGYAASLNRIQGLSAGNASLVMQAASRTGVNPMLLAAVMGVESSFGTNRKAGVNIMQVDPSSGMLTPRSRRQSVMEGAAYLRQRLAQSGGNVEAALLGYHEGPAAEAAFLKTGQPDAEGAKYLESFAAAAAGAGLPNGYLANRAGVSAIGMGAARLTYSELNPILTTAIQELLSTSAENAKLATTFQQLNSTLQGLAAAGPANY